METYFYDLKAPIFNHLIHLQLFVVTFSIVSQTLGHSTMPHNKNKPINKIMLHTFVRVGLGWVLGISPIACKTDLGLWGLESLHGPNF